MLHYFHKIGWRRNKEKEKENKEQQPLAWNFNSCFVALSYLLVLVSPQKKKDGDNKKIKKIQPRLEKY